MTSPFFAPIPSETSYKTHWLSLITLPTPTSSSWSYSSCIVTTLLMWSPKDMVHLTCHIQQHLPGTIPPDLSAALGRLDHLRECPLSISRPFFLLYNTCPSPDSRMLCTSGFSPYHSGAPSLSPLLSPSPALPNLWLLQCLRIRLSLASPSTLLSQVCSVTPCL